MNDLAALMQKKTESNTIVVLGTGGTIAGLSKPVQGAGYDAAQLSIKQLLKGVDYATQVLRGIDIESEQVAQLDSKNMDFETQARLAVACAEHLRRPQVRGIVVTHGTDTLEETAYFLHRVLPIELHEKPVVLTCAMRPADAPDADGPRNLVDAIAAAHGVPSRGLLVVCEGRVHGGVHVQKMHTHEVDAFSSGNEQLGSMQALSNLGGGLQLVWDKSRDELEALICRSNRPFAADFIEKFAIKNRAWPRVEIVLNHVNASGSVVQALLADTATAQPLRGIVVAGTGNGTLSQSLHAALRQAQQRGVRVLRASRCAWGGVQAWQGDDLPGTELSPVKARIELMLDLVDQ